MRDHWSIILSKSQLTYSARYHILLNTKDINLSMNDCVYIMKVLILLMLLYMR